MTKPLHATKQHPTFFTPIHRLLLTFTEPNRFMPPGIVGQLPPAILYCELKLQKESIVLLSVGISTVGIMLLGDFVTNP